MYLHDSNNLLTRDMVEGSINFVVAEAKKFRGRGSVTFEDLISAGNVGLMKAKENFDAARKNGFLTFAKWYIRKEMFDENRKMANLVPFPKHSKGLEITMIELDEDSKDFGTTSQLGLLTEYECHDCKMELFAAMDKLSPTEQFVINNFYGFNGSPMKSFSQIGAELNLTKQRAAMIKDEALVKIKEHYQALKACFKN
jgi:RNA polymerase primary sigma factor